MRSISGCLVLVGLLLASGLPAEGPPATPSADDLRSQVRAAESQRLAAMVGADVDALDELLDDCLRYHHSNGTTDTKDSLLESLRSGAIRYDAIEPSETTLRLRGPDAAEVRARAGFEVVVGDRVLELDLRYVATWNLIAGKWKMVAYRSRRVGE